MTPFRYRCSGSWKGGKPKETRSASTRTGKGQQRYFFLFSLHSFSFLTKIQVQGIWKNLEKGISFLCKKFWAAQVHVTHLPLLPHQILVYMLVNPALPPGLSLAQWLCSYQPVVGSCPLHLQDESPWLDWLREFGAEWWCSLSLRELFIMHSAAFIAWLKSLVKSTFINSDCPKAIPDKGGGSTDTQASKVLQDPKMLQCPWQSWVQSPVSLSQARTMDARQISSFKLTLPFMPFLQKLSSLFSISLHSATPKASPV